MPRIAWSRLLPRHQRLVPFWVLAGLGIAAAWLLNDLGADWPGSDWLGGGVKSQCRVTSISDGDTLRATCDGERVQVRLHCIDAPELSQRPWGQESRAYLRRIKPANVTLRRVDTDRYGRIVGEVFDGERSINLAMVRAGQATVFAHYCSERYYYRAQDDARAAGLGIWSEPGEQQLPWEWRRR